jgi:hypothetical protein
VCNPDAITSAPSVATRGPLFKGGEKLGRYRRGHAPEFLRGAFDAAVLDSVHGTQTPCSRLFFFDLETRRRWDRLGTDGRLRWASGQFWRSGDLMPANVCEALGLPEGSSYASSSRVIRARLDSAVPV